MMTWKILLATAFVAVFVFEVVARLTCEIAVEIELVRMWLALSP